MFSTHKKNEELKKLKARSIVFEMKTPTNFDAHNNNYQLSNFASFAFVIGALRKVH